MAIIHISNVSKKFGNKEVLNNFNFVSKENEFIVIVGPSGCGKTTMLRIISGLESSTNGCIKINDKLIDNEEPQDREVSMVFQNYALYPTMTVYENIAFPLVIKKMDNKIIEEKVFEMAKKLDIDTLLDRFPRSLSGGEKQRVAIGRAMIKQPKIYLFDEPLSNLDALIRDKMRTELKRIHKNSSAIFIYVTHDQIEAMSMADRIIVMKNGVIQQIDTPTNIYKKPANLFVAQFIGTPSINIISNKHLFNWIINDVSYNKNYIYAVRPEDIGINMTNEKNCGKIVLKEILGKEVRYHVQYKNERIVISDIMKDSELFNENDCVKCFIKSNKIHIFDRKTELNILK